jgi:hypothetical protein
VAGIGELNETPLHASLKHQYIGPSSVTEAKIEGFVVDIFNPPSHIIEIQTHGLFRLKRKLLELLDRYRITVVFPVPETKHITVLDGESKDVLYSRRSPKRGTFTDSIHELCPIRDILDHKNLTVEIPFIIMSEIRIKDGKGSWRRKGISIGEKILDHITDTTVLKERTDYLRYLPDSIPEPFTNRVLAETLKIPVKTASKITYFLRFLDVIRIDEKINRTYHYVKNETRQTEKGGSDGKT